MSQTSELRTTPLHDLHVELGAKMMAFGGYDMPVQYESIIQEHMAVRERAGLFDVSHMGEVFVTGPKAAEFVQHLVTNDVEKLYDGKAMYTVMCRPDGGVVDDLLVYRIGEEEYMLVINAANREKDWAWIQEQNTVGAELEDRSEEIALLAIQGPKALDIVQSLTETDVQGLKFYHFTYPDEGTFCGCEEVILSQTGYTGEKGLEIYCRAQDAETIWNALMDAGEEHGLEPAGLGARDTLRLEMGFCLYGQDVTEEQNPYEAGLGWLVKLDSGDFVGVEALREVKADGPAKKLIGFVMEERGIPRHGQMLADEEGEDLGEITSGTQSPILSKGIGMGYVPNEAQYTEPGSTIYVSSRGRKRQATVAKPPFHK